MTGTALCSACVSGRHWGDTSKSHRQSGRLFLVLIGLFSCVLVEAVQACFVNHFGTQLCCVNVALVV